MNGYGVQGQVLANVSPDVLKRIAEYVASLEEKITLKDPKLTLSVDPQQVHQGEQISFSGQLTVKAVKGVGGKEMGEVPVPYAQIEIRDLSPIEFVEPVPPTQTDLEGWYHVDYAPQYSSKYRAELRTGLGDIESNIVDVNVS